MGVQISEEVSIYLDQRVYLERIYEILEKLGVDEHLLTAIDQALSDNEQLGCSEEEISSNFASERKQGN